MTILKALAGEGCRALAIDQRGYSRAAKPETIEAFSIENLVEDILNIADCLNAKRFHLVGHDWGGEWSPGIWLARHRTGCSP